MDFTPKEQKLIHDAHRWIANRWVGTMKAVAWCWIGSICLLIAIQLSEWSAFELLEFLDSILLLCLGIAITSALLFQDRAYRLIHKLSDRRNGLAPNEPEQES